MNFLKVEGEEDIPNVLQFMSQEMEIANLTKPHIKDQDFDTMSGLQEIYGLDDRQATAAIQKQAGNVREAIKYVGAARALSSGYMRKAENALEAFAKNKDNVHWEEFEKSSGLAYDMLVAGGELSKSASDLLRSHKKSIRRTSSPEEIRFFAQQHILSEPPTVKVAKARWWTVQKNMDDLELTARFKGGRKHKLKVNKKEVITKQVAKLRKKFEKLSDDIRKLREEDAKTIEDLLEKDKQATEVGISRLKAEKKRLQGLIKNKKRGAKELEEERIKSINKDINHLLLVKAKLAKEGISPKKRAKLVRGDREKELIATREKLKEDLGLVEKKGMTDDEIREFALAEASQREIVDIKNAKMHQLKARLSAMNNSGLVRTKDAALEMYVNGLLSSVKTNEVNFLGNMTAMFTSVIDRMYAGAKSGGEIQFKEATTLMWGYLQELPEIFSLAHKSWKAKPNNNIKQDFIRPENRAISKEAFRAGGALGQFIDFIGSIVNFPGKLLLTADEVFKAFNYRAEVKALVYRKAFNELGGSAVSTGEKQLLRKRIDEITNNIADHEDITQAATDFAAKNTYTNKLADYVIKDPITGKDKPVQGLGNRLKGILDSDKTGMTRIFIPFFQTPANLLNFAWERTPLIRKWNRSLQSELSGAMGQGAKELAEARVATSRMMWGGMFAAAWSGNFTGAPPLDPNLRKTLEADMGGPHWYSHNIWGDGFKKYDRFDPLGVMMAGSANIAIMMKATANLSKMYEAGDPSDEIYEKAKEVIEAGVVGTATLLTDRHYLQGFAELIDIFTGDNKGLSKLRPLGKKLVQGFDPRVSFYSSFRRNMTRGLEPEKLEKMQRTDMQSMGDLAKEMHIIIEEALRDVTPGYGTRVPAKNLVGESVLYPGGNDEIDRQPFQMIGNLANAVLNPNPPLVGSKSPLIQKLAELESTQGQPSTIKKLNGITMTDEEKSFFVDRWTEWNKKLESLVISKGFKNMPAGMQRLLLETQIEGNKDKAKRQTMVAYKRLLHGTFDLRVSDMQSKIVKEVPTGFNSFNLMKQEE